MVDRRIAAQHLPDWVDQLQQKDVEIRGYAASCARALSVVPATEKDWATEFLSLILAIMVVDGVNGAVEHIDRHGTQHTASIVSQDAAAMKTLLTQVDANDGGELGLGAEVGISTTWLHAYGPMGQSRSPAKNS